MQFSSRFKLLCKEKKVTQKKALEDMGFHRNAVQCWHDGMPSADAILKISTYFDMTTDELLGVETKKQPTPISESELDNELIKMLVQLTPDEAEKVAAFAAGLIAARTV